jgi:hypothetical protein
MGYNPREEKYTFREDAMNSEFQIIRWGIPGWISLLTYFSFKMAVYDFKLSAFIKSFENPTALTGVAALFVALGVPLGYLIYQVYFWFKWKFGGRDAYLAADGIPELENRRTGNPREDWRAIEEYFDRLMTLEAPKKHLSEDDLERRFSSFSNRTSRTHGLGASLWAIGFGVLAFGLLNGYETETIVIRNVIILFATYGLVSLAIYSNYRAQNKGTFQQLNAMMKHIRDADEKTDKTTTSST